MSKTVLKLISRYGRRILQGAIPGTKLKTHTKNLGWSKLKVFGRLSIDIALIIFAVRFCLGWWHMITAGKIQAAEFMLMEPSVLTVIAEFTLFAIFILISIRRLTGDWRLAKVRYTGG